MAEFKRAKLEDFLGVTRKYMQVRGAMSQKDLAEQTDVGISTMSRFLSQKSTELTYQQSKREKETFPLKLLKNWQKLLM